MGVLGLHPSWYINVNLVFCHSPKIMRQPFSLLTPMLKILLSIFILCCTLLAGCGSSAPALKPFKMDIQQGNVVTSKMLLQLKPGMTKSQVRFIMGTPLIVDSFHKDRWDYFYQMRQAGKIVEQRRVILDFEKELLTKVRGDVVPQGTLGAAKDADSGDSNVISAPITVEPKPRETSMLDKLKFWKKDEKMATQPAVAAASVIEVKEDAAKLEAKPKTEEESLLNKLKFWKKDEPVTAAEKIAPTPPNAALPTEAAATVLPEVSETAIPSVLAVPMLAVPDKVPSAEAPNEEPVIVKPLQTAEKLTPKPLNPASVKELAAKAVPKKPLPIAAKQGEPLIFRMDKNLDLNRLDEVKLKVLPAVTVSTSEVNPRSSKVDLAPITDEAVPSYFDKLLEKIGF